MKERETWSAEHSLKRESVSIKPTHCLLVCRAQAKWVEMTEKHLFEMSVKWEGLPYNVVSSPYC